MPEHDRDPMPPADALRDALERARRGEREALPALREALDTHPEIWLEYGDLAAHAERSWVGMIAGPDLVLAEALGRKVAAMKADLAGLTPTPLERLLAARVAACWLQAHHADAAMSQAGEVSIRQADLAQKRQALAHKGYLMAIAALATVRRLLPAAQVAIPYRTDGRPTAAGPGDKLTTSLAAAALSVVVDEQAEVPANPETQTLFDRTGSASGPRPEADRTRGRQSRPAS